jgi:hypothetical protein
MREGSQRKLAWREEQQAQGADRTGVSTDKQIKERQDRLTRVRRLANGNPGLQDLLAGILFSSEVTGEQADRALAEMEAYLA